MRRLVDLLLFVAQIYCVTNRTGHRDKLVEDRRSRVAPVPTHRRQTVTGHDAFRRLAKVETKTILRCVGCEAHPSELARRSVEEERIDKLFRDVLGDPIAHVLCRGLEAFFRQLLRRFLLQLAKRWLKTRFRERHGAVAKPSGREENHQIDRGFHEVPNDARLVVIDGWRRLHRTVLKNQRQRKHAELPAFGVHRNRPRDGRWRGGRSTNVHRETRQPALLLAEDDVDRREQIEWIGTHTNVRPQELGIVLIDDRRATAVHEHRGLLVRAENERVNGRDADEKCRHHERGKVNADMTIDADDVEPRLIVEVVGHGFTSMLLPA